MTTTTSSPTKMARRKGRTRAILAGGIIAAIGIGGTLASWNASVIGRANGSGGGSSEPHPTYNLEIKNMNGEWETNEGTEPPEIQIAAPKLPTDLVGSKREGWFESAVRLTGNSTSDEYSLTGKVSFSPSYNPDLGGSYEATTSYDQYVFFAHPAATANMTCAGIPVNDRLGVVAQQSATSPTTVTIPGVRTNEELRMCVRVGNDYSGALTEGDMFTGVYQFDASPLD